jgi:uncharacterized membrane protein YhaH (DUF805 family)
LGSLDPALGQLFHNQPLINTVLTLLLVATPALWMWLALLVKRWHDLGQSDWFSMINIVLFAIAYVLYESGLGSKAGWWLLIFLIPIAGMGFIRGSTSANRFDEASTSAS